MRQKRRAPAVGWIVALAGIGLIIYGVHWALFDLQRLEGQEILVVSPSPNAAYTITAYRNNGGATADYAVLCAVKNNQTGKERNIYWNYHCDQADIRWLDDQTVSINGVVLDVRKDRYDYRRE